MSRGIVYIAFGEDYDTLASETIAYSRQFITCDITVITNLKDRNAKWANVDNVNFIYLDMPTNENRRVKIELYKHTPYDETLYVDVDAVACRDGIEKAFDTLSDNDIVFQHHSLWREHRKYYRIYRDTAHDLGATLPLRVCLGGFWLFRKTEQTIKFFDTWLSFWERMGSGRDMPALACAIQASGIFHGLITKKDDKLFSFGMSGECVYVHRVNRDDLETYGIHTHKQNKPFDAGRQDDWDMVYFDKKNDDIENDEWIKVKFNREKRMLDKRRHINKYLPEIQSGGLNVLDVGTGPGEMLEICQECGCKAVGIELKWAVINDRKASLYVRHSLLKHAENNLDVVYASVNDVMEKGNEKIDGQKFDIINCQHAINFFRKEFFDFTNVDGKYNNTGRWIFNYVFHGFFRQYFEWCRAHLNENGIVVISALHSTNEQEYQKNLLMIANDYGFDCEYKYKEINHRFRLVAA